MRKATGVATRVAMRVVHSRHLRESRRLEQKPEVTEAEICRDFADKIFSMDL